MKPTINLATKRVIQKKTLRKFFISSVLFFGGGVALTVMLLILNFFLNLQISNLNDQKSTLQAQIVRQQSTKDKLLMVQERLGQIRSLLTARNSVEDDINLVVASIPPTITIQSIKYDSKETVFSLATPSLSDLQRLIEQELPSLQEGANKNLGEIAVGNFMLDASRLQYTFSFTVKKNSEKSK